MGLDQHETNLPQAEILARVTQDVISPIWQLHATAADPDPVLKVYKYKDELPIWYKHVEEAVTKHRRYLDGGVDAAGQPDGTLLTGRNSQGRFIIVRLQDACELLRIIVENAYIGVFGWVFKQGCGIPMGISPGVYIANFFAFAYELGFLRQLTDMIVGCPEPPDPAYDHMGPEYLEKYQDPAFAPYRGNAARYVWHCFRFTTRFVDDMDTVVNPLFQQLMHTNQYIAGGLVHGIYPVCTPIEAQGHCMYRVPYLDVLKIYSVQPDGTVRGTTHLYDKRREKCYDGIQVVQFTPLSAGLAESCLYNIFIGQLYRYQRIIMDQGNFRHEAAFLLKKMVGLGYQEEALKRRLKVHLAQFPWVFPNVTPEHQYTQVLHVYQGL